MKHGLAILTTMRSPTFMLPAASGAISYGPYAGCLARSVLDRAADSEIIELNHTQRVMEVTVDDSCSHFTYPMWAARANCAKTCAGARYACAGITFTALCPPNPHLRTGVFTLKLIMYDASRNGQVNYRQC